MKPARREDSGLTLIELLITMVLMGVVSTLVVGAVSQAGRVLIRTDDEATGLADAKVVMDRLGRDIREARSAVCDGAAWDPTCTSHLQVWIDANSDYVEEPTEIITWQLVQDADLQHYDVVRIVGSGAGGTPQTTHIQASSLIVDAIFSYDGGAASAATAHEIDISLTYDSKLDLGSRERTAVFSARLRNKG
ncbi:type II secretion system protein [Isoptericola sp. b441]|uniref:Type II secretion system protein n=1 Tax=Actinotalea lenta TaxID=3064654 RepID=A0ABT9DA59_9CELL|nr:type II secretion system protein [Isoptericola sp. b441]MDO8107794.1 type II secretion system protein [Isoptericola sp. b441]